MEEHVPVYRYTAKEKSTAKQRPGYKLKYLRAELDSLTSEEAAEHEELKKPEEQSSKSKTVQVWHRDLVHNLRIVPSLLKVTNSMFCDARKLFGVNCDNKVTLRDPGYVGHQDIVLLQFDPNFMSTEVVCRFPFCNNVNPAAARCGKRDLYLCPHHQQAVRNSISDELAKNGIQISMIAEKPKPAHFAGYMSLISLLEGAFCDARKFPKTRGKSPIVLEVILNVKNFLIITSTVLNPDEGNLGTALPPVVEILKLILENPDAVERLVACLQEVIKIILSAFGVFYTWVASALKSPGCQIGAGMGGFIVLGAVAFVAVSPWSLLVSAVAGGTLGGLFGNGISNLMGEQRHQEEDGLGPNKQPHNQYPTYHFNGDANGGLDLHVNYQR